MTQFFTRAQLRATPPVGCTPLPIQWELGGLSSLV